MVRWGPDYIDVVGYASRRIRTHRFIGDVAAEFGFLTAKSGRSFRSWILGLRRYKNCNDENL